MKNYCIVFILFLQWQVYAQDAIKTHVHKTNWIMQQLYGPNGIQLSAARFHAIETLINNLLTAQPYELAQIVALTAKRIAYQKDIIEQSIATLEQEQKPIPPKIFFDRFVLETYLNHFKQYEKIIKNQLTFKDAVQGFVQASYTKAKTWLENTLSKKQSPDSIKEIAQQLIDYCDFERTQILNDYHKVARFLHNATHGILPPIMSFWQDNQIRNNLRLRSHMLTPEVQTQFWAEIGMIALQSIIMGGSSMYNGFISEMDAKKFKEYSDEQQKIQDDFTEFIRQTKNDQNILRKTISTAFIASATTAAAQYKQQNQQLNDETLYLFQAINLNPPVTRDLEYPSIWSDQQFEFSLMNTPQGIHWRNVFHSAATASGSDWEYDPDHNSFWQNGLTTIDSNDIKSAQKNHIFTEYSSKKSQYEIEVECRLINCQYPFFVGIMFNKARWISAVPERFFQCRLLGLYGTADAKTIWLSFAQQFTTTKEKDGKSVETFITPLEQIANDAQTHLVQLSDQDRTLLTKESITFLFNIVTQPNQVTITVTKKGTTDSIILQKTIDDLKDPYIALFGGIGFMAAGCQAEFILTKPESLVYTPDQIKTFKAAKQ